MQDEDGRRVKLPCFRIGKHHRHGQKIALRTSKAGRISDFAYIAKGDAIRD